METSKAQELFRRYAGAVACLEVCDSKGGVRNGSAFHVGDGVFVTARHVVANMSIVGVHLPTYRPVPLKKAFPQVTDAQLDAYRQALGHVPSWPVRPGTLTVMSGPHYHSDDRVDVAVLKVDIAPNEVPVVPLGSHLDDWIRDPDFVLSGAVVLGFPPIPMTTDAHLLATRAEINAVIHTWHSRNCSFVLSAMPRGGFSGGVVVSEWDFVLGMVVESLVNDQKPAELGFLTALGVEPIYECLAQAKLLPKAQREEWDDFWNTACTYFLDETCLVASVSVHDDGERLYIQVHSDRVELYARFSSLVASELEGEPVRQEAIRKGCSRWTASSVTASTRGALERCSRAVTDTASALGLQEIPAGVQR